MMEEHPSWILPEMQLLCEMVANAVKDLYLKNERDGAIDWLTDNASEQDEFSFKWICFNLGLDYEWMQRKITAAIADSERWLGDPDASVA